MELGYAGLYVGRRKRRSAVLPALMSVAALAMGAYLFLLLRPTVTGTVVDAYSHRPLGGTTVALGDDRATTNGKGQFTLSSVKSASTLSVEAPLGYAPASQDVPAGRVRGLQVALRPTTLSGTITRRGSGAPLAGIEVQAINDAGGSSTPATTGDDGAYSLDDVPEGARLVVVGPGFARKEIAIGQTTGLDLELRPDILTGAVRTRDGRPIKGATVGMATLTVTTKADGAYTLNGIPEETPLIVKASGYTSQSVEVGDATTLDLALDPLVVRGVYLTPDTIASDAKFGALVALADRTEINAMVLDFKDETGWLFHDSQNATAREIGAVHPTYDLRARLQTLKEHGIYAIARVVCMQDNTLATQRPEWAMHNSKTGDVWKNNNGVGWVNAMRPEVWQYDADIAVEAAQLGFNEVQYDYVRFPSDGDMAALDAGAPYTVESRSNAIASFLKLSHDALAPYGVPLAIDIFGIALWTKDDNGIGQQLEKLAPNVDYICPMVYPSHFAPGSLDYDIPNDHPYEVILQSLQAGEGRVEDPKLKIRPWLQDFTYGRGVAYGPDQVKAEMKAAYDFGATGWMLWNADNHFTEAALAPKTIKRP